MPHGFFLSATLHALVVAAVWAVYSFTTKPAETVKIFELVAGEGDNYMATAAPALGSPESTKLDLAIPAPAPVPPAARPEPAPPESSPIVAAPTPKAPVKEAPPPKVETAKPPAKKEKSFATQIRHRLWAAEHKGKQQAKKEREAEAKKAREAEQKRITKEQFDAMNRAKTVKTQTAKAPPAKVKKIDGAGIAKGVVGGSTANTVGGAGGKALVADEGDEVDRYIALLQQRLRDEIDQTPGLEDGLLAEAEFHILADGQLTRARIAKSSGNKVFDAAVIRAISAIRMPPRPKGLGQVNVIPITTRAAE